MKRGAMVCAVACCLAGPVGYALATDDPIAVRQGLMKNVGAAMRVAGGMATGKLAFDAIAAELAMRTINSSATGYPAFFPESSKTGGDTEAAPAIWTDMAGFEAAAEKLTQTSATAIDAARQGEDSFKSAFGAVAATCKSCHETYRVKK